jgi:hypothetical protein
MLLLLVYTLAEGLGVRYQAGHSPFAQPVYYYPEGKVHLFTQSSTKSWPRRVATSYLRKKYPRDPTVTGDGWILSDGRRVRDSTGGVHGSLYAWKAGSWVSTIPTECGTKEASTTAGNPRR